MSSLADFHFLDWQRDLIKAVVVDEVQAVAIRGGIGCGKSAALIFLAGILATSRPGATIVVVMDTYSRLEKVHQPLAQVILPALGGTYRPSRWTYDLSNGSKVIFTYYDRPAGRPDAKNPLEGGTFHAVLVDECGTFNSNEVWKIANNRARQRVLDLNGRECSPLVVLCGYPEDPCWWVHEVQKAAQDPVAPLKVAEFYPLTADNETNLSADYIARQIATLDPDEVEAKVYNRPKPKKGQVLSNWVADIWPNGNLLDEKADKTRPTTLAIDFGGRNPAVLFLQHDERRGLDIIVDDLQPDNVDLEPLAEMIRARGWNIVAAVGDVAGLQHNPISRTNQIAFLSRPVSQGGLGVQIRPSPTDPRKRDIVEGVRKLRARIEWRGDRRLVMLKSLWDDGLRLGGGQRTMARCIQSYRWDELKGQPVKDGKSDHGIDACRYWCVTYHWFEEGEAPRLSVYSPSSNDVKPAASKLIGGHKPWAAAKR